MDNAKKQNLATAAIILAVLLSIYVLIIAVKEWKSLRYVGGQNSQGYITVTGSGESLAVPDIATFSFSATEVAKTVDVARDAAAVSVNKALEIIKKSGVAESDIKTISYSIDSKYEYSSGDCNVYRCIPGQQSFVGYEVSQTVEVKVRDLSKVGQIYTDVSAAGIKNINGITFSVDGKDGLKEKARSEAITKAKAQAKQLSKDLGVKLVRVSSFYEEGDYGMPYYAKGGDMMEARATNAPVPEIPAGEQKITSKVSITYEIR